MLIKFAVSFSKIISSCRNVIRYPLIMVTGIPVLIISFMLNFIATGCMNSGGHGLKFERMLVEYAENPVNIDMKHPRFSWIVSSAGRNRKQTAYRIIVSSTLKNLTDDKPDLWDSGRIDS